jgi:hypothetical protein
MQPNLFEFFSFVLFLVTFHGPLLFDDRYGHQPRMLMGLALYVHTFVRDGCAARQLRMRMIDMLGIYYFTHTEN